MNAAAIAPGRVVAGRYRLESMLGKGGMGEVWRAQQTVLNAPVAIKFMDPALAQQEELTARFLREAQSAAALRSVHVVQILDYGVDAGAPYIVMEFLEGESLGSRLEKAQRLSPPELAHVFAHVARALTKAHELGIVHRDLKPDNVFLVPTGDEIVAKVLDFGIAKVRSADALVSGATRTGSVMGTPYYMSPEQVEGSKNLDARSDIWALGVIAFECLLGRKPFDADSFGELVLKICARPLPRPSEWGPVPQGFDEWFARAACREVQHRFQTVKAASDALRAVANNPMPHGWAPAALPPLAIQDQASISGVRHPQSGPHPAQPAPFGSQPGHAPRPGTPAGGTPAGGITNSGSFDTAHSMARSSHGADGAAKRGNGVVAVAILGTLVLGAAIAAGVVVFTMRSPRDGVVTQANAPTGATSELAASSAVVAASATSAAASPSASATSSAAGSMASPPADAPLDASATKAGAAAAKPKATASAAPRPAATGSRPTKGEDLL